MNILQLMGLTHTYFTASLNMLIYLNLKHDCLNEYIFSRRLQRSAENRVLLVWKEMLLLGQPASFCSIISKLSRSGCFLSCPKCVFTLPSRQTAKACMSKA